jgi:hypothetical protein
VQIGLKTGYLYIYIMNRIRFYIYYFLKISILAILCLYENTFASFAQQVISEHKHHTVFHESDVFVITNRQIDTSKDRHPFTNHVSKNPSLTFFRANASCRDSIRLTKLDSITFLTEIMDIKKQDWVLFLHGDNKPFEHAVLEGLNIQDTYNVRVIIFSWPSRSLELSGLKNLENSYLNLLKSSDHFKSVIRTMYCLRNSGTYSLDENKLSLFLHSLGNYYLENLVNEHFLLESQSLIFDNVIINSSAVEQKNHKKWLEQLHFQNNLFVTFNKQDINLLALRIFSKHGMKLGERAKLPFANNAIYFNFTKSVGFRLNTKSTHTYFIGEVTERNKNILHFYSDILHGLSPDLADETKFINRRESSGYLFVK